jgi:uncharacterized protein YjbI with pentapeptide repeats
MPMFLYSETSFQLVSEFFVVVLYLLYRWKKDSMQQQNSLREHILSHCAQTKNNEHIAALDLTDCDLTGCDLRGLDLSGVTHGMCNEIA